MLFSIILTNYNYQRFLRQAIDSVLAQSYSDFQFIIIDDGSTDGSKDIIDSYQDSRIEKVYRQNGGQAAGFNDGFRIAKGEYLAFIDADDYWSENKLETCFSILKKKKYALVQHNLKTVNESGISTPGIYDVLLEDGEIDLLKQSYGTNNIPDIQPTTGLVASKEALSNIFPLDTNWKICADLAFVLPLPIYGEVYNISEKLGFYRIHGSNGWMGTEDQNDKRRKYAEFVDYLNTWLKANDLETLNFKKSYLYSHRNYMSSPIYKVFKKTLLKFKSMINK